MPGVKDSLWTAQDTTPSAIEAALRELLAERHAEHAGYVPARVLNLVCVVDKAWSGEIANRLRSVGDSHASRTIVCAVEPGRSRIDAIATIASDREPGPGALYTTLDRLEDKGLIKSRLGDPTPRRGGRAKRYFQVSAMGVEAVARAQRSYRRLLEGLKLPGVANA